MKGCKLAVLIGTLAVGATGCTGSDGGTGDSDEPHVNAVELELEGALNRLGHVTWLRVDGYETSEVLLFTSEDLGSCSEIAARFQAIQALLVDRVQENRFEDTSYHLCADDIADMRELAELMEPLVGANTQNVVVAGGTEDDAYFAPFGTGTYPNVGVGNADPYNLAWVKGGLYTANPISRSADEAGDNGCAFLYETEGPPPYEHYQAERFEGELSLEVEGAELSGSAAVPLVAEGGEGTSGFGGTFTAVRCDVDIPDVSGFGSLPFVTSFAF